MRQWPNWLTSGVLRFPETEVPTGGTPPAAAAKTTISIGGKEYSPEQAEAAISLHKAMSDPETSQEIVQTLAQRMGLLNKQGEVKDGIDSEKARTQLEGRITKALKQKLGKEYAAFADMVGPAFDEAISSILEENRASTETTISQNTWSQGVDKFLETHTLTDEIQDRMKELVDEAPPNTKSKTFDQQKYLNRMYKTAIEDLGIEAPRAPKRNTREADDDDADSGETRYPKIRVAERPKLGAGEDPLDRIVDDAMKGIRYKK